MILIFSRLTENTILDQKDKIAANKKKKAKEVKWFSVNKTKKKLLLTFQYITMNNVIFKYLLEFPLPQVIAFTVAAVDVTKDKANKQFLAVKLGDFSKSLLQLGAMLPVLYL